MASTLSIKWFSVFLMLILLSTSMLFAQAPETLWTKTFGGYHEEQAFSVQQTLDGGYILTGWTKSFGAGDFDVYLIKTDDSGNLLWEKTLGGINEEKSRSVQQTTDGGYIIAGRTASFGAGNRDVWFIKTDAEGDTLWTRTFGGGYDDDGTSVQQTSDGGYIVTGWTKSFGPGIPTYCNIYLIKTDAGGDTLWTRTFGGAHNDVGFCVQETADSGYVIAGYTLSFGAGGYDVYLIKTDDSGNLEWEKTFGRDGNEDARSVRQTSDGGYIVGGCTDSFGAGGVDAYLLKTDRLGGLLWEKTFGGGQSDGIWCVKQASDGGYIMTGWYTVGSFWDVWFIRTNDAGDSLWAKTIGGSSSDVGNFVCETSDSGYVIAGNTMSYGAGVIDIYLIKIAKDLTGMKEEFFFETRAKEFISVPSIFTNSIHLEFTESSVLPLKISFYNIYGVPVFVKDYPCTPVSLTLTEEITKLPSGIYFISVSLDGGKYSGTVKVIKL